MLNTNAYTYYIIYLQVWHCFFRPVCVSFVPPAHHQAPIPSEGYQMASTSASSSSCRTLRLSKVQIGTLQPPVSQGTEDYNGDENE